MAAGMYGSPEYRWRKPAVYELGFEAYKYRPALGPEEDFRTVELMRQAVGSEVGLCLMRTPGGGWATNPILPPRSRDLPGMLAPLGIT